MSAELGMLLLQALEVRLEDGESPTQALDLRIGELRVALHLVYRQHELAVLHTELLRADSVRSGRLELLRNGQRAAEVLLCAAPLLLEVGSRLDRCALHHVPLGLGPGRRLLRNHELVRQGQDALLLVLQQRHESRVPMLLRFEALHHEVVVFMAVAELLGLPLHVSCLLLQAVLGPLQQSLFLAEAIKGLLRTRLLGLLAVRGCAAHVLQCLGRLGRDLFRLRELPSQTGHLVEQAPSCGLSARPLHGELRLERLRLLLLRRLRGPGRVPLLPLPAAPRLAELRSSRCEVALQLGDLRLEVADTAGHFGLGRLKGALVLYAPRSRRLRLLAFHLADAAVALVDRRILSRALRAQALHLLKRCRESSASILGGGAQLRELLAHGIHVARLVRELISEGIEVMRLRFNLGVLLQRALLACLQLQAHLLDLKGLVQQRLVLLLGHHPRLRAPRLQVLQLGGLPRKLRGHRLHFFGFCRRLSL
mmetsp:Transcript_102979/g.297794  ORF Transcript_102979/g.297794 Transcript_102979/m.297794 type:complete len:480 (-) Transcript_102979:888-2327(-)